MLLMPDQQLSDGDLQGATEPVERVPAESRPVVVIQLQDGVAMETCLPCEAYL
jgi:hypothetical protein